MSGSRAVFGSSSSAGNTRNLRCDSTVVTGDAASSSTPRSDAETCDVLYDGSYALPAMSMFGGYSASWCPTVGLQEGGLDLLLVGGVIMTCTVIRETVVLLLAVLAAACVGEPSASIGRSQPERLSAKMLQAYRRGGVVATLSTADASCDSPLPPGVVLRRVGSVELENTPLDFEPDIVVFVGEDVEDNELITSSVFLLDDALSGLTCPGVTGVYFEPSGSFRILDDVWREYVLGEMISYPDVSYLDLEKRPTDESSDQ